MSKAEPGLVPGGGVVQMSPAGPRHLGGATYLPPVLLVREHVRKSIYNGARTLLQVNLFIQCVLCAH